MSYLTRQEAKQDREQQQSLLYALEASQRSLHRDECGAWCIHGDTGKVYTWGDGKTWVLYVSCPSARQWTGAKQRLSFLTVIQDCDNEGCLKLLDLPTPQQASVIRSSLGLRKRRHVSQEMKDRLMAFSFRTKSL